MQDTNHKDSRPRNLRPDGRNLKVSKKHNAIGLFIFCNKCCGEPKDGACCKESGKCKFPDRHVFKVRFHIPGTKKGKVVKKLDVRDQKSAAEMAQKLYNDFKSGIMLDKEVKIDSVSDYARKFLDFKENPTKNRKPIGNATINDYIRHFELMFSALESSKINPKLLSVYHLSDMIAQKIFDHLKVKFPSELTQAKYFKTYRNFYNYLIGEEKLTLPANPFNGWNFGNFEAENLTIFENEFNDLLKSIDMRGTHELDGNGKKRVVYYPWLKHAFRLALFTGVRRQEVPEFKWSDIHVNKRTGSLSGGVIISKDIKVTNIKHLARVKLKPIEINDDLADLLASMGYKKNVGKDEYLIASGSSRKFIKDQLSRSFAFYIKFASKRSLQFKCLRKTWFTASAIAVGDKSASLMGGHSSEQVTVDHYINQLEKAGANMKLRRIFLPEFLPEQKKVKRK